MTIFKYVPLIGLLLFCSVSFGDMDTRFTGPRRVTQELCQLSGSSSVPAEIAEEIGKYIKNYRGLSNLFYRSSSNSSSCSLMQEQGQRDPVFATDFLSGEESKNLGEQPLLKQISNVCSTPLGVRTRAGVCVEAKASHAQGGRTLHNSNVSCYAGRSTKVKPPEEYGLRYGPFTFEVKKNSRGEWALKRVLNDSGARVDPSQCGASNLNQAQKRLCLSLGMGASKKILLCRHRGGLPGTFYGRFADFEGGQWTVRAEPVLGPGATPSTDILSSSPGLD